MKKYFFLLFIVGLGILQVTLLDGFRFFSVRPDFLLIAVVIASLTFDLRTALLLCAFAGIFKDLFGATGFGFNTVLFTTWSFLIIQLSRLIPLDEMLMQAGLVLIVAFLHNLVTGFYMLSLGSIIPFGIFLRILILETLLTALFFPLLAKLQTRVSLKS